MNIGFTGTQRGMTTEQGIEVGQLVFTLDYDAKGDTTWHHGDCIGADEVFHAGIRLVLPGRQIVVHPPKIPTKRAFCQGDVILKPDEYIKRDDAIIDVSNIMIATPGEMQMQWRSGTWTTIRHTRKAGKPIYIVYPDGSVVYEPAKFRTVEG